LQEHISHYPWGDEYQAQFANVDEIDNDNPIFLGRTSAVGIYPKGKSPCGALDMIGNVWEWLHSDELGDGDFFECEMRGGSWADNSNDIGVGYSSKRPALTREPNIGFRVLCR